MNTLFCYSFQPGWHEPSGMPNFYHQVISKSETLSSNPLSEQLDSLDNLSSKVVLVKTLNRLGLKPFNGNLNLFSITLVIAVAKYYSNLVFIGPVGFFFAFLLRLTGYKNRISIILYDVTFVDDYPSTALPIIRLKCFFKRLATRVYFSQSSNGQLLVLCSSHFEKLKNYNPSLALKCFKYGVYTPFYRKHRSLLQHSSFKLAYIHPKVQPFKYCIAIGSAYRNDTILKCMASNSKWKDRMFLKISIDHSMAHRSIVQHSWNFIALYNFSAYEYLELLFSSASALVLSARPSSMSGLTTILECISMKKQVFVQETCFLEDYVDDLYVKRMPTEISSELLFNSPPELSDSCEPQASDQYHECFLEPAKQLLEILCH